MIVYLGGPINGCTDDEAHGWRDELKPILESKGHTWLDPMSRDYRGREDEMFAEVVDGDKQDINSCDVMIMFCPRPSNGTAMEILYGWERYKQVITVHPWSVTSISPWVRYHSTVVRGHPTDAISLISR